MTSDSSASKREETPHANETSNINIHSAVKRRAQSLIKDQTIDAQTRGLIQYALEINDQCLAEIVRRVDAGNTIDGINFSDTPDNTVDNSSVEKSEALSELICCAGDESAAALLVLMATLEHSAHPKLLANIAKHLAFTHCGEFDLESVIDADVVFLESKLLSDITLAV